MSAYRTGALLVVVACVFFAMTGIVARIAIDGGLSPATVAAVRTYGGAILLLPFVIMARHQLTRAMIVPVALYAVIGIFASQGLYFETISRLDIALALVISYLAPLPVALYQHLRVGEELPRYAYGAMVIAIGGIAVAVLGGTNGLGEISAVGLVLAFATMATFAVMLILAPRQPSGIGALARAGLPLLVAAILWFAVVPVWTLPFDQLGDVSTLQGRFSLEVPLWTTLLWVAVLGSIVPFGLVLAGAARTGAGAASMLGMAEPVVGALLAWVVLGQLLTPLQMLGIVGTIAAVGVVEHARLRDIRTIELPEALPPLADDDRR